MNYSYRVFGLSLSSDIECPELLSAEPVTEPDIFIRRGDVPRSLAEAVRQGSNWQTAPRNFLIHTDDLGAFHVFDGRQITLQPSPGVAEDAIRLFLLGGCLAILMHQRRLFVLHCSGVAAPRGAVLFAGQSGAGKSTMVGALLERGYKTLADDMLALNVDDQGRVIALPGFPQVKLWQDSAEALGRSTHGLRRVLPSEAKYVAPERERFSAAPAPLHVIYDLQVGDVAGPSITPLTHTSRFNILLDHTWQKATLDGLRAREWHFQTAARIASLTYAARLTRPPEPLDIQRTADLIEADMLQEHLLT